MTTRFRAFGTVSALLLLGGCSRATTSTPPDAQVAQPSATASTNSAVAATSPREEAKSIFTTRCAACHGAAGHGDGAAAAALNPKPRNFADKDWQKSKTDEQLATVIVKGGAAVNLSALMAPNADLEQKPDVVKELVALVRDVAK